MFWTAVAVFGVFIYLIAGAGGRVFRLGYISGSKRDNAAYDRPGFTISGAISLAVDQINRHHPDGLLMNHTLEFSYEETFGREDESIQHTARLSIGNVSAIIGPQETCLHEARIASSFNTLMLSYFCQEGFKQDDKNEARFSTFVHVKPHVAQISKSVASILLRYNWRKIAFVNSIETVNLLRAAESIKRVLEGYDIQITKTKTWKETFYMGFGDIPGVFRSPFKQIVEETKDHARIFVVVGTIDNHVAFMNAMEDQGLLDSGDYFVVGVYLEQYRASDPAKYLRGVFEKEVSQKSIKAFHSFLAVIPSPPQTSEFVEFNQEVNKYLRRAPFSFPWDGMPQKSVRPEAAYLHDAVMIYARALNECLANISDCPNPHDGNKLVRFILDRPYISAMGYGGYIDASGNAQGNYSLLALKVNPQGETWNVGLIDIAVFSLNVDNKNALPSLVFKKDEGFLWPHYRIPEDEPACGFDGSRCIQPGEKDVRMHIAAGLISGFIVLTIIFVVAGLAYKRMKYERELQSFLWKLEWRQLNVEALQKYLRSHLDIDGGIQGDSLSSLCPVLDIVFADIRIPPNLKTQLGFYRNLVVAVKVLKKHHVSLTRQVMKELKSMREIRNDNLCGFIGATLAPVCIVTEFCQRGSLKDILYDENVALDDMFISSLIADIVNGMCYLHMSSIKSHGNLKPTNCLVDSRFVLKITDYGLHEFKRITVYDPLQRNDPHHFEGKLWTAPELLREAYPPLEGSPRGDVYSFSIVLYEIYGRSGPFGRISLPPQEIVTELRLGREDAPPLRPILSELVNVPDFVLSLIMDCWNEAPALRPDFQMIKARLKPMQGDMKPNIMDNVMALLQRYANNLETLVNERTIQLEEEKKKTESLLYEILPRPVAEHLIKQEKVEAEQFDSVTIFFSDIVGFTALSADSTPLEVVSFLNDLYTLFDSLLEQYDAYKVETIGDSYMVCSGLPIRNGDSHAGVIASFSLHLVEAIKSFRIRHRPTQQLLLRIGIHSGPVVAGVVGMKMPRYCLFGDTVNTTSRYESTGQPQKIHCSPQCKLLLDNLNGYVVEPRGLVHMKGKGDLLTYWLVDEDEQNKMRRQHQDFASLSDLNRASPVLAKWGYQAKRRLSTMKKVTNTPPSGSPSASRRKLDSESHNHTPISEESAQGSLPNIIKVFSKELKTQCERFYENGGIAGTPLLKNYRRSESRSASCTRANSTEMLNVAMDGILVT